MRIILSALVFVASTTAMAGSLPFRVVKTDAKSKSKDTIYEQNGISVLRNAAATDAAFEDIYIANVAGAKQVILAHKYGEVLHSEPGQFFVLKIEEDNKIAELSGILHQAGLACGAVLAVDGSVMANEPVAAPTPLIAVTEKNGAVARAAQSASGDNIKVTIEELIANHTRYHSSPTGQQVATQLSILYRALAHGREDVEILTFDHGSITPQDSLIVRIKGTTRPNEVVVLGSHLDSVNMWGGTTERSPGADDNASGTATNLEVFRVLMEQGIRPQRTIEIHAYAAEEIGLKGSQDIAAKYKAQRVEVVSMVQFDMNLFSAAEAAKIWLVSNNTNADLNTSLTSLIDSYVSLPWGTKALSGGNSDHYSWTRNGFAAAFPFEDPANYNDHIHTADDTIEKSGRFDQALGFAKLGVAYLSHFAGITTL
jgi:leucyl aminopeptidase